MVESEPIDASPIAAFDYLRELQCYRGEIDAAIASVIDSGALILGAEVLACEREFAALVGVKHAIGVASGTDALSLALRACGIASGDGVITVANTAVPTVSAIRAIDARPLFVDIDPGTLQMSVERLDELLQSSESEHVRCVLPVHLHGQGADMHAINALAARRGLVVIGDCAQAHGTAIAGRNVAQWAEISCYSFYPTKNLAAFGDGGMCVTHSDTLAEALRELRQYGFRGDRVAHREGVCSRLDELQAAILRVRMRYFQEAQLVRQRIADHYRQGLADCQLELPPLVPNCTHAWHQFVVRTSMRDELSAALRSARVGHGIHYPQPIHLMPAYEFLGYRAGDLPCTELAAAQILSLPMYPTLRDDEVERVISVVRGAVGGQPECNSHKRKT